MSKLNRVYVSCVADELGSVRSLVVNVLISLGITPEFHKVNSSDPDQRPEIQQLIDTCDCMIQIIGDAYGPAPDDPMSEFGPASYAQFEFFYGRSRGLKQVNFFALEGCERDHLLEELDLPCDPKHPAPDEWQKSRRMLQQLYRAERMAEEDIYHEARSNDHLLLQIMRLEDRLLAVHESQESWRQSVAETLQRMAVEQEAVQSELAESLRQASETLGEIKDSQLKQHEETREQLEVLGETVSELVQPDSAAGLRILVQADVRSSDGTPVPVEPVRALLPLLEALESKYSARLIERVDLSALYAFEQAANALAFCVLWHRTCRSFSEKYGPPLEGRIAADVGEVTESGAMDALGTSRRVFRVPGRSRTLLNELIPAMSPWQTLVTRAMRDLSVRASGVSAGGEELQWVDHGAFLLAGAGDAVDIIEMGVSGEAPFTPPEEKEGCKRARAEGDVDLEKWRPVPDADLPGRPHWNVRKKIGEGGFGEVWSVEHEKTGELRVCKFCFEPKNLAALRQEVKLLGHLRKHPDSAAYVVRMTNHSLDIPPYYMEMQYYPDGSLADYDRTIGGIAAVDLAKRQQLTLQAADSLAAVHAAGVVHGDFKPSNLLLERNEKGWFRVLVTDFGNGCLVEEVWEGERRGDLAVEHTGDSAPAAVTSIYQAPELMMGDRIDFRSDIFAFGVTMYQLVIGNLREAIGEGWAQNVLDGNIRGLIGLCIRKSPDERVPTLEPIRGRLRTLIGTSVFRVMPGEVTGDKTPLRAKESRESYIGLLIVAAGSRIARLLRPIFRLLGVLPKPIWVVLAGVALFVMWKSLANLDWGMGRMSHHFSNLVAQPGLPPGLAPIRSTPSPDAEMKAGATVVETPDVGTVVAAPVPTVEPSALPPVPARVITTPSISPLVRAGRTPAPTALEKLAAETPEPYRYSSLTLDAAGGGHIPEIGEASSGGNYIQQSQNYEREQEAAAIRHAPILAAQRKLHKDMQMAAAGGRVPLTYGRVTLNPGYPKAGEVVEILCNFWNTNLAAAPAVYIHAGVNGWQGANRFAMQPLGNDIWRYAFTLSPGTTELNFAFTSTPSGDQGVRENNGGKDWNIPVL